MKLVCTLFITLNTTQGPTPTRVELPGYMVEASELRYSIDFSEAVARFPNADKEVNYKKLLLSRGLCRRS